MSQAERDISPNPESSILNQTPVVNLFFQAYRVCREIEERQRESMERDRIQEEYYSVYEDLAREVQLKMEHSLRSQSENLLFIHASLVSINPSVPGGRLEKIVLNRQNTSLIKK